MLITADVRRGRIAAMAAAALATILLGLLFAYANRASCSNGTVEVACPADPLGPDGRAVIDQFFFVHRPLGTDGSITVRMASMTGIITYPPPDHDQIVSGLVPWAKGGIMIKDGVTPGSAYAALMVTGSHGVRMQHDYTHDVAGRPGAGPRWLRLTRSRTTITGAESADGEQWTTVSTARFTRLPDTVQVGLFATSPGDLTLRRVALGGRIAESRFTQASATFDHVGVTGAPAADWTSEAVGEMGHTDWERLHRPPGLVTSGATLTVTGSGDVGPAGEVGPTVEDTLVGLAVGLIVVVMVAARRPSGPALVGVAFVSGLVAAGVVLPIGTMVLRANGNWVAGPPVLTDLRVVVGVGALFAAVTAFTMALGVLLRRTWAVIVVAVSVVIVPYLLAAVPLLPDEAARWLLRVTPAAGFAIQQTVREYPQVVAHYAPSAGYFPLPWWAGFAVLCGYTAVVLGLAARRRPVTRVAVRTAAGGYGDRHGGI
jgi:hypothetical protein